LLIRDKLSRGDWERHLGASESLFVNASTWGLMLTGRLTRIDTGDARDPKAWYERIVARAGEPVVRLALRQAMKVMAEQFVMGRTIDEALARSRQGANAHYRYSFDMLGEAAITAAEAERLELSLELFARARRDPSLEGWEGLGLAVQAYQKRGRPVVRWVAALARETRHRIPVRLVKGAYWDTEIKRAQVLGLS